MEPLTGAGAAAKRKAQRSKPAKEELLTPSHEEAKELCRLAQQIGALAPWEWMEETDVFGVQDPVTSEIGFVSIMGALGEYPAIAVYRGAEGLHGWLDFESALELDPERPEAERLLLEIPHLHVSFSDSNLFEKRDRDLLKGVGLKFTGDRPLFRSSRPGYLMRMNCRQSKKRQTSCSSRWRAADNNRICTESPEGMSWRFRRGDIVVSTRLRAEAR